MRALAANKRPKITLKKLGGSITEMGVFVHRTTVIHKLHRAGLHGKVCKKNKANCLKLAKIGIAVLLFFLALKDNTMADAYLTSLIMLKGMHTQVVISLVLFLFVSKCYLY